MEEGHDVEFENYGKEAEAAKINGLTKAVALLVRGMTRERFFQNDEIVGILKQLKDEMSGDLTAFKKKRSDRKTNYQDLTNAKTKEIFVLIKATVGALKLEQGAKKVAQARPIRPPPWRDKLQSRASCCRTE